MTKDEELSRLMALIFDFQNGTIDDAGIEEVRAILRHSAEARRAYAQAMLLDVSLQQERISGHEHVNAAELEKHIPFPRDKPYRSQWKWGSIAAAILCVGLLIGWAINNSSQKSDQLTVNGKPPERHEKTYDSVALISRMIDAEWGADSLMALGSPVLPGKLELVAGFIQLDFYSGARVVLQGPTTVEIVSSMELKVMSGKIRAEVPPIASGFVVDGPLVKIIDIGTEFAVEIRKDGSSDVHTITGKIDVFDKMTPPRKVSMVAGQAMRFSEQGKRGNIVSDVTTFANSDDLDSKDEKRMQQRLVAWESWNKERLTDKRLVACYTFNNISSSRRAQNEVGSYGNGSIVGCQIVRGRWQGKPALAFNRPGDRVRFVIPGEFSNLTYSTWIRVDELGDRTQSILLTDGYEIGRPHWQISADGHLRLGIRLPDREGQRAVTASGYASPAIFGPKRIGIWTFLCTVYNRADHSVRHYVNGREVSHEQIVFDQPLRIGRAEMGNWGFPFKQRNAPIRYLNGQIDELSIYNAALSAEEIHAMYSAGQP